MGFLNKLFLPIFIIDYVTYLSIKVDSKLDETGMIMKIDRFKEIHNFDYKTAIIIVSQKSYWLKSKISVLKEFIGDKDVGIYLYNNKNKKGKKKKKKKDEKQSQYENIFGYRWTLLNYFAENKVKIL